MSKTLANNLFIECGNSTGKILNVIEELRRCLELIIADGNKYEIREAKRLLENVNKTWTICLEKKRKEGKLILVQASDGVEITIN